VSLLQMLATSITLASVLLASHLVDVHSSTNCPSSQSIAEHLYPLLPDGPGHAAEADTATVEVVATRAADTVLRIYLMRANGAEVGDRRVIVQDDCGEAATAVAAVIAAWEIEPLPPPQAVVSTPVPTTTSAALATTSTWQVLLGASGGVGLVGGVAALGRIETLVGKSDSRVRGRIGFGGETTRTRSLASGSVDWRHSNFELGVLLRTLHPVWSVSLDTALVLGWATLAGSGFAPNRQQRSFEYGGSAAVRMGRSLGRWSLWAEARTRAWAWGQKASVTGDETSSANLPRVDVTTSLGISRTLFW